MFIFLFLEDKFEFIKSDVAILIKVVSVHDCFDIMHLDIQSQLAECSVHILFRDSTRTVRVKHAEDCLQLLVIEEGFGVYCSSKELSIVDLTVTKSV